MCSLLENGVWRYMAWIFFCFFEWALVVCSWCRISINFCKIVLGGVLLPYLFLKYYDITAYSWFWTCKVGGRERYKSKVMRCLVSLRNGFGLNGH